MRSQLGALFAAGYTPAQVGDLTWDQALEASVCIQIYHSDLAHRVITGRSAFDDSEEPPPARTSGAVTPPADEGDLEAARRKVLHDFQRLSQSQLAEGSAARFEVRRGPERDLFAEFRARHRQSGAVSSTDEAGSA